LLTAALGSTGVNYPRTVSGVVETSEIAPTLPGLP